MFNYINKDVQVNGTILALSLDEPSTSFVRPEPFYWIQFRPADPFWKQQVLQEAQIASGPFKDVDFSAIGDDYCDVYVDTIKDLNSPYDWKVGDNVKVTMRCGVKTNESGSSLLVAHLSFVDPADDIQDSYLDYDFSNGIDI